MWLHKLFDYVHTLSYIREAQKKADKTLSKSEAVQANLDKAVRENTAAFENSMEEQFLLRDEVAALAKYFGLLFTDEKPVKAVPSEDDFKILEEAIEKAQTDVERAYLDKSIEKLARDSRTLKEKKELRQKNLDKGDYNE